MSAEDRPVKLCRSRKIGIIVLRIPNALGPPLLRGKRSLSRGRSTRSSPHAVSAFSLSGNGSARAVTLPLHPSRTLRRTNTFAIAEHADLRLFHRGPKQERAATPPAREATPIRARVAPGRRGRAVVTQLLGVSLTQWTAHVSRSLSAIIGS